MAQIKIVPDNDMNAEGEWIEVPVSLAPRTKWLAMEAQFKTHVPAGFHIVAVQRDRGEPLNTVKLRP